MRGMKGTCRPVLPSLHIGSTANEMTGSNVIRRPHSRKKNQRVRTTGNQLPSREITGPRTMGEGAHRNRCATVYSHCETALALLWQILTGTGFPNQFFCDIAAGVRFGCVLADAGYGLSAPFRQGLTARKLAWAVGIPRHLKVYPADVRMIWPVAKRGRPRQRHVPDILSIP